MKKIGWLAAVMVLVASGVGITASSSALRADKKTSVEKEVRTDVTVESSAEESSSSAGKKDKDTVKETDHSTESEKETVDETDSDPEKESTVEHIEKSSEVKVIEAETGHQGVHSEPGKSEDEISLQIPGIEKAETAPMVTEAEKTEAVETTETETTVIETTASETVLETTTEAPKAEKEVETEPPKIATVDVNSYANQVILLINQERARNGLPAFGIDPELMSFASVRANECSVLFSHERPSREPAMVSTVQSRLWVYGENCHMGGDPSVCVNGWMSSEMHRNALLSEGDYIGVGVFQRADGCIFYVAEFGMSGIY